jgi:hypothetical protein
MAEQKPMQNAIACAVLVAGSSFYSISGAVKQLTQVRQID